MRGLSIWYAFIIVITLFNPVASGLMRASSAATSSPSSPSTSNQSAQKPGGYGAVILNKEMFTPSAFIGALWGRDYETVARYAKLNKENGATIAEMVHVRTRPIGDRERAGALARFDALVCRIAA